MDRPDLKLWIWLNALNVQTKRPIIEALESGQSIGDVFKQIETANFLGQKERFKKVCAELDPEKELEGCERQGFRLIPYGSENYPQSLKLIYHPPLLLYVLGNLYETDQDAIAVVGTRLPSFYGMEQTRRFVRAFSEKGLTIVSGLAKGIDQIAHETAMTISHGRTIGILGCGLDVVYPPGGDRLYENMKEKGAVVSEYPLGTKPLAYHFPERNRIISGLSQAVLVIEAHHRSGSLITAHEALEEGKEVFAVPGPVDQLTSRGTHRLIKEGAYLAEDPEDILEILYSTLKFRKNSQPSVQTQKPVLTDSAKDLFSISTSESEQDEIPVISKNLEDSQRLLELLSKTPLGYDDLVNQTEFPSYQVNSLLTQLELNQKIKKLPQGIFTVVTSK